MHEQGNKQLTEREREREKSSLRGTEMARLSFSHLLLFTAATAVILSGLTDALGAVVDMTDLCRSTDFPSVCTKVLKSSHSLSQEAAVLKTLRAMKGKAKHARDHAAKLATQAKDGMAQNNLQSCLKAYGSGLDGLDKATTNIQTKVYSGFHINLSGALTSFGICEQGFSMGTGMRSPMTKYNDMLKKMGSNCVGLASNLH